MEVAQCMLRVKISGSIHLSRKLRIFCQHSTVDTPVNLLCILKKWEHVNEMSFNMRQLLLLLCCIYGLAMPASTQIVINEIIPPGTVEIISQGATPVNIQGFWLASGANQIALADLTINCGGFVLEQGEFLVVEGFNVVDPLDGEMALFLTNDFDDADDIIDYVEWGSSGHTYANLAQLAGMWPVGDFVPAWDICNSLEYEGTGNGDIHWTAVTSPSECAVNGLNPCIIIDCEITETGLDNVLCNNNSTIDIPSDDYITFVLNPQGMDIGDSYTVSVNQGNVFPTMADYGAPTMFQLQGGSAGGGDVEVTITDNEEPTCGVSFLLEDPGSCSENCSIFDSGLFGLECDNNGTPMVYNDDRIVFNLDPNGFNTGDGYEIEADPGNVSPDIGNFNAATLFTMQPGSAGGGDIDVLLRDLDIPSCAYFFVIEDPGACSQCFVDGGTISTDDSLMVCAGDDVSDIVDLELTNASGSFMSWIVATSGGTILNLDDPPYDFDLWNAGNIVITHISYEFDLQGLEIGEDIEDFEGCYDISNSFQVLIADPAPALIGTAANNTLCTNDGGDDDILINVSGGSGSMTTFIITTVPGEILFLTDDNPINFEGTGGGTVRIRLLHYEEGIMGLAPGNNISELEGCFAYSNFLNIFRLSPVSGVISTNDPTTLCVDDGVSDPVNVIVDGASGGTPAWIITNNSGFITSLPASPPFNFEGSGQGISKIYYLRFENTVTGLETGNHIDDLGGCFQLSNAITITKITGEACDPCQVDGGTIETTDPTMVCAGDGNADLIDVEILAPEGDIMRWVIADPSGMILAIQFAPPFNFDNIQIPLSFIYHISYEAGLQGLEVGGNLDNLDGCFDISNGISVEAVDPEGGQISTEDTLTHCTDDGIADLLNVNLTGASGSVSAWVLTDGAGNIFSIPSGTPFDLEGTGNGLARVYHISYEPGLTGLSVGNNISGLSGCFELSNSITVLRLTGANCVSATIDLSLSDRFDLSPNPAGQFVFFETNLPHVDQLSIFDVLGNEVFTMEGPRPGDQIDLHSIGSGLYIVQIRAGKAFGMRKLVVQY